MPYECNNSSRFACIVLQLYRDVLHIKILDGFDCDCYLTYLNFQISSRSNGLEVEELPASYCNFTEVLLIVTLHNKISKEYDDLCMTLLNFKSNSSSSCLVNPITPLKLYALCNFTQVSY